MRFLLALLILLGCGPALAQETPEEERSWLTGFVENQLSAPNRQIRLGGIQGVLSSEATIGSITIADREGVWLRIVNARINWSRSALLLGRLDIRSLGAERIEVTRLPVPDEAALPSPESTSFELPELPVAVILQELQVERVVFGEPVFGLASELAVGGRLTLRGGSLDTALNMTRLDGPGGTLNLAVAYANDTEILDLDLALSEPENGIVANALNIEGRPPIDLSVAGSGPLDDLDVALTLDADAERIVTGNATLDRTGEGTAFAAALGGNVARLIPPIYRDFFGDETALQVNGVTREAGGTRIDNLALQSAALNLQAAAETTSDGFLSRLTVDAAIGDESGERILLPVPGGQTTIESGRLQVSFGAEGSEEWGAELDLRRLATEDFGAGAVRMVLDGVAQNIADPQNRRLTYRLDGAVSEIVTEREDVAEALGSEITVDAEGSWAAGEAVLVDAASIVAQALSFTTSGRFEDYTYDGELRLATESLSPFSALAGRELEGGLELAARGTIAPISGAFDLALDGTGTDLTVDIEAADNLLAGATRITGEVARSDEGLITRDLRLANEQFEVTADGRYATGTADFGFDLALADLALLSEQASGRLTATGRAVGSEGPINLTLEANVPTGRLAGRNLTEAQLSFDGNLQDSDLDGQVAGRAFLDGALAELSALVALNENERRLADLSFVAGGARLEGSVVQDQAGLIDGTLTLAAPDVSTAAALFLLEASGAVNARIVLTPEEGQQNLSLSGDIADLELDAARIGRADITAEIADLFGVPAIAGNVDASNVSAGGVDVRTLVASAERTGEVTDFTASAELENNTSLSAAGSLAPEGEGYRITLDNADLAQGNLAASLLRPASVAIRGETVEIDTLQLNVGSGRVEVSGVVAQTIDLDVAIAALPLNIANTIRPDLELQGTIDANARITGSRDAPEGSFRVQGRNIAAAALRAAGLGALTVDASGRVAGQSMNLDATVNDGRGFNARAAGSVPLGDGNLALDVTLGSFPLATLNTVVPDQQLAGNLSGTARVGGTLSDPDVRFDMRAAGVSAAPLAEFGAAPLNAAAAGHFANNVVMLDSASAQGPQGLSFTASGRVPLEGTGLGISVRGNVPLALANSFLVDRGTQFSGTLAVDANVSGSISNPSFGGTLSTAGASVIDPLSNLRLNAITLNAGLSAQSVTINSFSAQVASGGSISAGGTVSLDAAAGFPADISVTLNQARYTDGELVTATVSGALALSGPVMRDPLLSGNINIERAELSIAGSLGGGATAIDVIHVNPPPAVAATLRRARASDGTPQPTSRPSVVRLDVTVNAPNQIFVRGRGLDAELGGQLRLTGPVTAIQPVGGFNLIRGRLSILGQRITFDEGEVTLIGDLDPYVDFIARTEGTDITVFITVRGRLSNPEIEFSSQPGLPQDEVLARLIFNRSLSELSAFQIARLAAAAAELAGGEGGGLLGNLRDAAGLDDLDIVSDGQGNTAVRAGRYIQDNIYLGVEAGSGGTTRGTINLDITDDIRARGSVGTDGDTSLGIFYERDY